MNILALNCGSSSLKYALWEANEVIALRGEIDRIGVGGVADHAAAVHAVFDTLAMRKVPMPNAVGHRLVHGGPNHLEPVRVDDALLASLALAIPFAPLHLPAELRAIEAVRARFADVPQVVCFDTAFHRTLPEIAQRFALPAALFDAGIRRYGFHGLSYEYVVETLGANKLCRAVIAHLGSGASMAAVRDGQSIDTTMAFTPTAGLVMGTRSGDLDPGLIVYLLQHRGYDARTLERLVNHEAGLLALSGTTPDMQVLLERRKNDARAALAIAIFCQQAMGRRARSRARRARQPRLHRRDRRARTRREAGDLSRPRAPRRRRGMRRSCHSHRRRAHDRAPHGACHRCVRRRSTRLTSSRHWLRRDVTDDA